MNEEYEQTKRLLAKMGARAAMIPPVHSGLPRDVSGAVLAVRDGGTSYDIILDPPADQQMLSV